MLWRFEPLGVYLEVSKNSGTPKSSILIGFSLINHPFWGTPIFGNTHFVSEFFLFSKMWMKMLGNFDSHHCQPCFRGILLEGQNSEMMECFHSCRIFCDAFGSMLHSAMQKESGGISLADCNPTRWGLTDLARLKGDMVEYVEDWLVVENKLLCWGLVQLLVYLRNPWGRYCMLLQLIALSFW